MRRMRWDSACFLPADRRSGGAATYPFGAVSPLIRTMRPQEWVKNSLVFAGLLFSRQVRPGGGRRRRDAGVCGLLRDLERRLPVQRPARRRARPAPSREAQPADRQRCACPRDRHRCRDRSGGCRHRAAAAHGRCRGGRPGRPLRGHDRRLLADPQAPGDHRRDDHRLPLHPPGRRRSGRRRGPGIGVPARVHRDARPLPGLYQAPAGGDPGGHGHRRDAARARALLASLSSIRWSRWSPPRRSSRT